MYMSPLCSSFNSLRQLLILIGNVNRLVLVDIYLLNNEMTHISVNTVKHRVLTGKILQARPTAEFHCEYIFVCVCVHTYHTYTSKQRSDCYLYLWGPTVPSRPHKFGGISEAQNLGLVSGYNQFRLRVHVDGQGKQLGKASCQLDVLTQI